MSIAYVLCPRASPANRLAPRGTANTNRSGQHSCTAEHKPLGLSTLVHRTSGVEFVSLSTIPEFGIRSDVVIVVVGTEEVVELEDGIRPESSATVRVLVHGPGLR
jgi:hypothetical protein